VSQPGGAAAPDPVALERWTVTTGSSVTSRAAVVLRAAGHDWKASAEGAGAVDALFRAVDAALGDILGGRPQLLAYDVHALAEGPDAEGRVTVQIAPPVGAHGDRGAGRYAGEVSSPNTIAASVEAYVEALNAMLGSGPWSAAAGTAAASASGRGSRPEIGTSGAEFDDEAASPDTTGWFNS
jgi:2-isopropylmalate synthase